jgi:hypothetical protein
VIIDPTISSDVSASEAAADGDVLSRRVLGGEDRDLQILAARGVLPLEPRVLATLQFSLRLVEDPEIAEAASLSLQDTDPRILCELTATADQEALSFLCDKVRHPSLLRAVLQRHRLSPELLIKLAKWLPEELQEALLLRQEDIRSDPEILEELEKNPQLSSFSRRMIGEYRRHLLPDTSEPPESDAELEAEDGLPTEEEMKEAIETVAAEVPAEGQMDEQTGLSDMQIRSLPAGARMKLTYGASRELRNILIRDNNPQIAIAALLNSSVSETEIELLCSSRNVVQEVLGEISRNRRWMARYGAIVALAKNPRTPDGIGIRLVSRLSVRDLRSLSRDRGVSQAQRTMATRVLAQKTG